MSGTPLGDADERARSREPLVAYAVVTLAYWAFMLTDGALRMLVLLHFHTLGFTPLTLAWLFLLYELAGIATNLFAGWIGTRFGLNATLLAGLLLQVFALLALAELDTSWSLAVSVAFVMLVQGVAGVAKDLTKTSAKSAVKQLSPGDAPPGSLFRLVAVLTGSKNAVKGAGFLLGALLLGVLGFREAVLVLALGLTAVFLAITLAPPRELTAAKAGTRFREVFSTASAVNRLSAARVFLFGARDTWFVVGVPVYLHDALSNGVAEAGMQAAAGGEDTRAFFLVGGFMAVWIIGYGAVQASAPALLGASRHALADTVALARRWAGALVLLTGTLALIVSVADSTPSLALNIVVVGGLLAFGVVFAFNSSLHSYLILALSGAGRTTMDVGFYYMANATGRLLGTLLSGLSYQAGGLAACLGAAAAMTFANWLCARRIPVSPATPSIGKPPPSRDARTDGGTRASAAS